MLLRAMFNRLLHCCLQGALTGCQKYFLALNSPAALTLQKAGPCGASASGLFIEGLQIGQGCDPCTKAAN